MIFLRETVSILYNDGSFYYFIYNYCIVFFFRRHHKTSFLRRGRMELGLMLVPFIYFFFFFVLLYYYYFYTFFYSVWNSICNEIKPRVHQLRVYDYRSYRPIARLCRHKIKKNKCLESYIYIYMQLLRQFSPYFILS